VVQPLPASIAEVVVDDVAHEAVGEAVASAAHPLDRRNESRVTDFVEGVEESLPNPHDPLHAIDRLAAMDALTRRIVTRVERAVAARRTAGTADAADVRLASPQDSVVAAD